MVDSYTIYFPMISSLVMRKDVCVSVPMIVHGILI